MKRAPPPIPVTVLTGFLGSGKTTLLNHLLADPALSDTAVLINEFGEVGLDHLLVRPVDDGIIMLSSGCVCCSVRGDLVAAFEDLLKARDNGRITAFNRVVVETTGLADPIPVIHTLLAHPYLVMRYRLDAVVTVVDAINGLATLAQQPEAVRQVMSADRLVISKSDLANTPQRHSDLAALRQRLKELAPLAPQLDAAKGEATAEAILRAGLWQGEGQPPQIRQWLNEVELSDDTPRHGEVKAFALTHDRPIAASSFEMFLDLLRASHGPNLLRYKGLVHIAEYPDRPLVIHGAQHLMHPTSLLDAWPDGERRTRLVFITRKAEPAAIEALFNAFAGMIRPDQPDAAALTDNPLSLNR